MGGPRESGSPGEDSHPEAYLEAYPEAVRDRNRWVVERRGARVPVDPRRPAGWLVETEPDGEGREIPILTVFLTNRECPWRCVFCDLWKHTLERRVGPGDLAAQWEVASGDEAVREARPRWVKLYNAGSFFDPGAIPGGEWASLAERVRGFDRVIVESHPRWIGDRVWRWRDLLRQGRGGAEGGGAELEVAMGLETANPAVLERLNKGVTLDGFRRAASALRREGVALRVFVLVQPPFEEPSETVAWAVRSAAFAFECGAGVVSLIPVRPGNGALEALQRLGQFTAPRLGALEQAWEGVHRLGRGRVFADLWGLETFRRCSPCFDRRLERLAGMNRSQAPGWAGHCASCGDEWGGREKSTAGIAGSGGGW